MDQVRVYINFAKWGWGLDEISKLYFAIWPMFIWSVHSCRASGFIKLDYWRCVNYYFHYIVSC